jgi:hypothetical protein
MDLSPASVSLSSKLVEGFKFPSLTRLSQHRIDMTDDRHIVTESESESTENNTQTSNDVEPQTPMSTSGNFCAEKFANKDDFCEWFPQIKDDLDNPRGMRQVLKSKRNRARLLQTGLIGVVLIINLALVIFASAKYDSLNGVVILYEGDCARVGNLDKWLHLLINLLGTAMLSASNYCMQLRAAPTREDIDRAHEVNRSLDIGIPSLRNLRYIGNWRRLSWVVLAFSSIPIHLMYYPVLIKQARASH